MSSDDRKNRPFPDADEDSPERSSSSCFSAFHARKITDSPRRKKQNRPSMFRSSPQTTRIYRRTVLNGPAVDADVFLKHPSEQDRPDTTSNIVFFLRPIRKDLFQVTLNQKNFSECVSNAWNRPPEPCPALRCDRGDVRTQRNSDAASRPRGPECPAFPRSHHTERV